MNIVRVKLPKGLTNEAAVERLAAAGCTEATVGAGKAGVLVLDYDGPLDFEEVSKALLALGLEDFERGSILSDDDLDHKPGPRGFSQSRRP